MAVVAAQKDNYSKIQSILQAYAADEKMKPVADEIAKLKPIWENYGIESGKKIEQQKVAEVSNLAESVRLVFVK